MISPSAVFSEKIAMGSEFRRTEPETHISDTYGCPGSPFPWVPFFWNGMRVKIVLFYFKAQWGIHEPSCCIFGESGYGFAFNGTRNARWVPFTGIWYAICVPLLRTEAIVRSEFPRTEFRWGSSLPGRERETGTLKAEVCQGFSFLRVPFFSNGTPVEIGFFILKLDDGFISHCAVFSEKIAVGCAFHGIRNPQWVPFSGIQQRIWVPFLWTEPNLSSVFAET